MFHRIWYFGNLQFGEQLIIIFAVAVEERIQHVQIHGFPESAGTGE